MYMRMRVEISVTIQSMFRSAVRGGSKLANITSAIASKRVALRTDFFCSPYQWLIRGSYKAQSRIHTHLAPNS